MALNQYNSQVPAPVAQPAYSGQYYVSDAPAQMVASVGRSLGQVGNQIVDERRLKTLMQEKYQSHLDDLKTMEVGNILKTGAIEMQSIYENAPPEQWEQLITAKAAEITNRAAKVIPYVSPELRDALERELKGFEAVEFAKMESLRLKEVKNRNLTSLLAAIQQKTAEGNKPAADLAIKTMMDKWPDFYASEDEAKIAIGGALQRGQAELSEAKTQQVTDYIENYVTGLATQPGGSWESAVKKLSEPETVEVLREVTGAGLDQIKKAMEAAKGFALAQSTEIETDEVVRYGLKTMALDIWRGTTTKEKFDIALTEARQGVIVNGKLTYRFGNITSDTPLLDKEAYTALSNEAADELKSAQAEAITRYTKDTANVILGPIANNLFTTDEQGNFILLSGGDKEQAKYMLDFVNRYEDELRLWIAENPTKSGKEFYQFAQQKKYEYWNTSIDRMKERAERRKAGLPEPTPTPQNETEYNNLTAGTEYVAPDGSRRIKG